MGEIYGIIARCYRLEAEDFNERTLGFVKTEACVDHSRIVVHQHRVGREQLGKLGEDMIGYSAIGLTHKQFALISEGQRVLCDALVGEVVVEIVDF